MTDTFTASARRLGLVASVACVALILAYAATLAVGLSKLPSQQRPIDDPYFSVLEILIIALLLPMLALMSAVHAWAPPDAKANSRLAIVFTGLLAGVTGCVHFVILTVGHAAVDTGAPGMSLLFSFTWPSVAYALEIFAWDVLFALAMLFASQAFVGRGLVRRIRMLLLASGTMALVGLISVVAGDMRWRFIGIAGYVVVFPVAVTCIGVLFNRSAPGDTTSVNGTPTD